MYFYFVKTNTRYCQSASIACRSWQVAEEVRVMIWVTLLNTGIYNPRLVVQYEDFSRLSY